jgi:hypothetical protein
VVGKATYKVRTYFVRWAATCRDGAEKFASRPANRTTVVGWGRGLAGTRTVRLSLKTISIAAVSVTVSPATATSTKPTVKVERSPAPAPIVESSPIRPR